jgi:integrase/recombinase XerD
MNDGDFQQVIRRVESNKSEATVTQYVAKVRDFREWLQDRGTAFEEADAIDVENWLAELDEKYTNASSVGKGEAALVAAFEELNKLIQADRVKGDNSEWGRFGTPAEQADYTPQDTSTYKSRETRENVAYLSPSEVNTLAKNTERLRDELIVRILFQCGLRVTELCHIRVTDVDRDGRAINVRGKGRKNRTVYYQPSLDILMDVWLDERRPAVYYAEESPYLFPTSHSECITRQTVAEIVKESAKRAGLQDTYGPTADGHTRHTITPHVLRHSFAMAALDNGWDVYTLSQALGHADAETTTSTYLHDDDERNKRAFRQRGPSTDG